MKLHTLLITLVAFAPRAHAETEADIAFKQGRELLKAGKYAEACVEFEKSQQLDPQLGTQWNIAQCQAQTGKLASALALYKAVQDKDTNAQRKALTADLIAKLEPRVPQLHVQVHPQATGLVVKCDPEPCTTDGPIDLGTYTITATAPGYRIATTTANVEAEAMPVSVSLELEPMATATPPPPKPESIVPVAEAPAGKSHRKLIGIGVLGVGVASAATGLVFGSLANSKWKDAKAVCGGTTCMSQADLARANELADAARSKGNLSTAFVIVGGVAIAAGVALWLTAPTETAVAVTAHASDDGAGVSVSGRF